MSMDPFSAELAAEHRRDLLQRAAEYRLARGVSPARRHVRVSRFTVRVRRIRPEDAPLLADMVDRLTPAARLAGSTVRKRGRTAAERRYVTDVDHHDREALLALTRVRREPVGIAGFVRRPDNPASADITLDVVDEWQNRGVGSMLAARLVARARCGGITQFTALMPADNLCVKRLLTKMGNVRPVSRHGADRSYLVALATPAPLTTRRHATPLAPAGCAR